MTATLAAELDTRAAHMVGVRKAYDHTKADHASPDGCGICGIAFVEGRSIGWDYDPDGTPLACGPCVTEAARHAAQMAAANDGNGLCSRDLHDMTDAANHYHTTNGRGGTVLRCRECYRVMNNARKARDRQAAKVAG